MKSLEIKELLKLGAKITIDVRTFTILDIKEFIKLCTIDNQLTLCNAGVLSPLDLKAILQLGSQKIHLDFTNN